MSHQGPNVEKALDGYQKGKLPNNESCIEGGENMQADKFIARQGDVLIKQIEQLPDGIKRGKDKTLAYGEVTGHSHRFADPSLVELFLSNDGLKYLKVNAIAPLIHEEHKEIKIMPGLYEVLIEREYDYIDEELKVIRD